MRIFVPIKLRTCTRCLHPECPHCVTSCDTCEEGCPCFSNGDNCVYEDPPDSVGYAALETAYRKVGNGGDVNVRDGIIVFSDGDEPTAKDLEAWR